MATPLDEAPVNAAPLDAKIRRRHQRWAFQRALAERTFSVRGAVDNPSRRLAVEAGDARFLLDLIHTGEVLSMPPLTSVPGTQAWFLGLANIRGNLVGVVDLADFAAASTGRAGVATAAFTPPGESDRLLIFAASLSVYCAMRVSRVTGLTDIAAMTPEPALQRASATPGWVGMRYRDAQACLWTELDLAALAQDKNFLDIRF